MSEKEELQKENEKHEAKVQKIRMQYGLQAKRRLKKLSDALQLSKQLNALDKDEFNEFIQVLSSNNDIARQVDNIIANVTNHDQSPASNTNLADLDLPLE